MHYFPSRQVAGSLLADELEAKYRFEDCAILALNDASVIVGAQIAMRLHCVLTMLLSTPIRLQSENDVLAQINHLGNVTYSDAYSSAELDEIKAENFNYIEQQKLQKLFEMNRLLGQGGVIDKALLLNRYIIVVSDGLVDGLELQAAMDFLKPIRTQGVIIATPFATVKSVDQMHILADEIVCLNVLEDVISVNHYYEDNTMPSHERIVEILEDIVLHWK